MSRESSLAVAMTIASGIFWGTSFVAIKSGLEFIDAYWFAFLRLLVASASSLLVLVWIRGFDFAFLGKRTIWLAGIANGLGFILQYEGLLFTTAGRTALLVNVNVIFVGILSWTFFHERFARRKNLGVILGILGVLLLTTNGDIATLRGGQFLGDLIVFSSGLVWAVVPILYKTGLSRQNLNVIPLTTGTVLTTTATIAPFALIMGGPPPVQLGTVALFLIGYTGIFCTTVPVLLWGRALKSLSATVSSVILLLEIAVAVLLSFLLLGEVFTLYAGLGALLILIAILMVTSRSVQ